MNTAKDDVRVMLDNLSDKCTLEDIQYHLFVIEKVHRGVQRAETEATLSQQEVERKFDKWITK